MMNPLQKEKNRQVSAIDLCMDILGNARDELYLSMRFFDVIVNRLNPAAVTEIRFLGTDGINLFFETGALMAAFLRDPVLVNRAYLHSVFHCLFGHLSAANFGDAGRADSVFYDLACDIVAESVIDSLPVAAVRRRASAFRKNTYARIRQNSEVLTPKSVCRELESWNPDERTTARLKAEFTVDDHAYWEHSGNKDQPSPQELMWKELSEKLASNMETYAKEESEDASSLLHQVQLRNRRRYDYRKFLKQFAVLKEEAHIDPDSFDPMYYHYGMTVYGNMPIIEPLETREVKKIEDFVIAIDTSMSCKEELIRKFLEETFQILSLRDSFFGDTNIHIIQCDDQIQSDKVIRNQEDLKAYMEHLEVRGLGGTDFRPVFGYVHRLLENHAFGKLKGLIYFTDGYGTFPVKRPPYDTAFVFLKEDYTDINVPAWAMKIIVEPDELGGLE